jgi:ubiquinone/menaquinone biosynthesis C-methylase UbiE
MKLNFWEWLLINNPIRAAIQRNFEARLLLKKAGRLEAQHVLEIGCGRGIGVEILFERFLAAHVTAIDVDPRMVDLARHRLARFGPDRLSLVVGSATAIDAADAAFDAVFDFGIIHHIPVWQQAVAEVSRVLKPGGLFLFEEVSKKGLDRWSYRTFFDHPRENRFFLEDFLSQLRRQGIRPEGKITELSRGNIFIGVGRRIENEGGVR